MDRVMRGLFLLAAFLLSGPAVADSVIPRVGPLPILAVDGSVSGTANVQFGQKLTILSENSGVLTVQDGSGEQLRVRATDVIAAPKVGLALMPANQPPGSATDRPDLQLWDSAFQLRVFLAGAGSGNLVPSLTIPAGSDLGRVRLPIMSIEKAETSVGSPVTMVQALFPILLKSLDPAGQEQGRKVVLHVLVDGSDYPRPFMVEKLRLLSRALAERPTMLGPELHFTRQILFESGAVHDDGMVSASGLRSEWSAAPETKKKAGLTAALTSALQRMADGIDPTDHAVHLVLILLGPGLSDDAAALKSASAVGASLAARRADGAEIRGILLAQGTPEPNPANGAVLADVAGGAETKLADFGADLLPQLADLTATMTHDSKDNRVKAICTEATADDIPCVIPANSILRPEAASALAPEGHTTWVAVPLWLVSESAPLDLVPDGSVVADVHVNQADIRACAAAGSVWDAGAMACSPTGAGPTADPSGQLAKLQEELITSTSERDAARNTLSLRGSAWNDERADLGRQLASANDDRDAARMEVAKLEAKVASQTAALQDSQNRAAAQAGQLIQLATEALTVKAGLVAARKRDAELSFDLDQRTGELSAAISQLAKLGQADEQKNASLAAAQSRLAAEEDTVKSLAQSLDEAKAAKDDVEAKAAQAQAALQERLISSETRTTALERTTATLSQSLDKERAAKADSEAKAAQAQADLEDRLGSSEKGNAALEAQIAQAQTTIAALMVAKDDVSERLAKAEAETASAEQGLQEKAAEISDLNSKLQTLTGSLEDSAQHLADLDATLADERQHNQTAQADAAAEIIRLNGEVADLAKTGDVNATLLAQSHDAQARLTRIEAENDALAKANADAASKLKTLSSAAGLANAKVVLVSQDLAVTRQKLEATLTESMAQIEALQEQVKALTKTRGDLSDSVALLSAEKDRAAAAFQAERDTLVKRIGDLQAQLSTLLVDSDQPVSTTDPSAAAVSPPLGAETALRPKPRPTGLQATAAKSVALAAKELTVAAVSPFAKTKLNATPRQVAPTLNAPGLNGCKFEWSGQAGRLVCP